MEIKTFITSSNALLAQKSGNSQVPIQIGQLAVVLYTNNTVIFDIAGSSFELLPGTKIQFQSAKDYKRSYHFVSDPINKTLLVLKVNDNYDGVDKIFKEGAELTPLGSSSFLLNSSSFKSISKSDPSKLPSIKFTQSVTIGGTTNPNSSKTQPSISPLQPQNSKQLTNDKNKPAQNQNNGVNGLGVVPKGAQILGQGVNSVGQTLGQTTGNLVGGIVGGLANIGQGLYNGVKSNLPGN